MAGMSRTSMNEHTIQLVLGILLRAFGIGFRFVEKMSKIVLKVERKERIQLYSVKGFIIKSKSRQREDEDIGKHF